MEIPKQMDITIRNNKTEYELPYRKFVMLPILFSSLFGIMSCFIIFKGVEFLLSGAYFEGGLMTIILIGCINSLHKLWFLTAKEFVIIDPNAIRIVYKFYGFNSREVIKIKNIKSVELVNLKERVFGNSYKYTFGYSDIKIVIRTNWMKKIKLGKYIDLEKAQLIISEIKKQQAHNKK